MRYDHRGVPDEFRTVIKIKAKVPDLDRYYFGYGCHGDNRRGVVTLEPGFGCQLGEFRESNLGVHDGYFLLDKELSPDDAEPYTFSFRAQYHTDRVWADKPIISQPKTETRLKIMHLQFTPPALPSKVWWYDVATAVEIANDQPESHVLPYDPGGYYYHELHQLVIGRVYGMDWKLR